MNVLSFDVDKCIDKLQMLDKYFRTIEHLKGYNLIANIKIMFWYLLYYFKPTFFKKARYAIVIEIWLIVIT